MLSFLNAIPLWLGLAAAVPVIIHFLGRTRTKRIYFPSLLLFKQQFKQASKRHKIKNLLLLICRLFFIACLLAALMNPIFKSRSFLNKNTACLTVINNGAWSMLKDASGKSLLDKQIKMTEKLTMVSSTKMNSIYFFPQNNQSASIASTPRTGNYPAVIKEIESVLNSHTDKPVNCYLPVFDWGHLEQITGTIKYLTKNNPLLKMVLIDYSYSLEHLEVLTNVNASTVEGKYVIKLGCSIFNLDKNFPGQRKIQSFFKDRLIQEKILELTDLERNQYTFNYNLTPDRFIYGSFLLHNSQSNNPFSTRYFSFQQPGKINVLHAGTDFTSLPSLGRTGYFKNIRHLEKLISDSIISNFSEYDYIYLANSIIQNDKAYGNLLNYVKKGGTLIIGIGHQSDLSKINREILVPAKIGYLRLMNTSGYSKRSNNQLPENNIKYREVALRDKSKTLRTLVPKSAYVHKQLSIKTHSSANTILSNNAGPLLIHGKYQRGNIYLWATDMDNLEWTGIGASAFIPAFYHHIMEGENTSSWQSWNTISDSVFIFKKGNEDLSQIVVLGPDGKTFNNYKKLYQELHIGPFNRLGNYQIISQNDTTVLSVNLDLPTEPSESDKIQAQFQSDHPEIHIISPEKILKSILNTTNPLWKPLIFAALIFFLLESMIMVYLAPRSRQKT